MNQRAPSKVRTHKSKLALALLRAYESRNVTFFDPDGSWPVVWERARGVRVWDADGHEYLDLTAAFGVAAAGHGNPRVVKAGQRQMARLLHAMGDVHPHALKGRLARELSRVTFERWTGRAGHPHPADGAPGPTTAKTIFCNSGFEAVEAALKTALLATGKPGVAVFQGAYHGLGYGALNATHRPHFRTPFLTQLRQFGHFIPFPQAESVAGEAAQHSRDERGLVEVEARLDRLFRRKRIGAIVVEPVQVRGGVNIPPAGLLPLLRRVCDAHHALLVLDEIYTGFGRTGQWFACEHWNTIPDLICLGKALTGGFPLSACVGRAEAMDAAWPSSAGEAIHTSTFLGHPVGCAMALAQLEEIRRRNLVRRSAALGVFLLNALSALPPEVGSVRCASRGLGLLAGVELREADGSPATSTTLAVVKTLLHRGFIFLPEGEYANVISFTPPLTITEAQLQSAVRALQQALAAEGPSLPPRRRARTRST